MKDDDELPLYPTLRVTFIIPDSQKILRSFLNTNKRSDEFDVNKYLEFRAHSVI